jgi:hypothetical protein
VADPFLEQHFTYVSTVRATCKTCGVDLDVRAGRARRHLEKVHGVGGAPELTGLVSEPRPPGVNEPSGVEPPVTSKGPPRGSREWAVELVLTVADAPGATPEQKLKALDLLKEYESFESAGTFDDELEREKFMAQWDRAISRAKTLRDLEKALFRDPLTRQDVLRSLQETV